MMCAQDSLGGTTGALYPILLTRMASTLAPLDQGALLDPQSWAQALQVRLPPPPSVAASSLSV